MLNIISHQTPLFHLETTLKCHPNFRAPHGVSRDLVATLQLNSLSAQSSFLPFPQVVDFKRLHSKFSACEFPSQSLLPREPNL